MICLNGIDRGEYEDGPPMRTIFPVGVLEAALLAVILAVAHRVNDDDGLSITDRSSNFALDMMLCFLCVKWARAERRFVQLQEVVAMAITNLFPVLRFVDFFDFLFCDVNFFFCFRKGGKAGGEEEEPHSFSPWPPLPTPTISSPS